MTVLYNPHAGGPSEAVAEAARARDGATAVELGDAAEAVGEAAARGERLIVAAGGDGTVRAVAAALLALGGTAETRPALGVAPLGTGNDFARALGVPRDLTPAAVLDLLAVGERRAVDAIRVTSGGAETLAMNAVTGGFSVEAGEAMSDGLKDALGPWAYVVGAARALPSLAREHRVRVVCDGGETAEAAVAAVGVANGQSVGGGTRIAPAASLEDGRLDVVLARAEGPLDAVLTASWAALAGAPVEGDGRILHLQSARVEVTSEPPLRYSVDGELGLEGDAVFEAVPGALRAVVGPGYAAG